MLKKTTVGIALVSGDRRQHIVDRRNCGTDFAQILGQRALRGSQRVKISIETYYIKGYFLNFRKVIFDLNYLWLFALSAVILF